VFLPSKYQSAWYESIGLNGTPRDEEKSKDVHILHKIDISDKFHTDKGNDVPYNPSACFVLNIYAHDKLVSQNPTKHLDNSGVSLVWNSMKKKDQYEKGNLYVKENFWIFLSKKQYYQYSVQSKVTRKLYKNCWATEMMLDIACIAPTTKNYYQ
jgi:hypothetical protein